jgi:Flp pilus assembly pilin Flp
MSTRLYVKARIRLQDLLDRREAGQGTLEYLGVVVIVAILVVAAVTAFDRFELGAKIEEQLTKIGNAGG